MSGVLPRPHQGDELAGLNQHLTLYPANGVTGHLALICRLGCPPQQQGPPLTSPPALAGPGGVAGSLVIYLFAFSSIGYLFLLNLLTD
jgi:hypothetical protein